VDTVTPTGGKGYSCNYLTLGCGGASLSPTEGNGVGLIYDVEAYHYARIDITGNTLKTTIIGQRYRNTQFQLYDTDMGAINLP
jgi:hypothetical protein